jgi:amino acid adenylation domain-containing protein
MLGILRARAVFVPLETSLPAGRLSSMINQANCNYVITDQASEVCKALSLAEKVSWINVEDANNQTLPMPDVVDGYELDDHVYVYFTSGSTGNPKGVIGKNKGLSHFIAWEISKFKVDQSFRFSQFTNPGFDVFLRDIFVPLCAGATICVPDAHVLSSPSRIASWIEDERINLIHCVPSFFKLFKSEAIEIYQYESLKYVLLAGEKILPYELKSWYKKFGTKVQLVNIYGPTETTLAKGCYLIQPEDCEIAHIPIVPIPGSQFLILDSTRDVCPANAVGEIYIRTPYRSAGYLDRDYTSKAFLLNPFTDDKKDIIYKTGDLGRQLQDGKIEILGRSDHQVKVRGIRIELDDIRENILKYSKVSDSVVMIREDAEQEKYICAYVVAEKEIDLTALRNYLGGLLPAHMIPSYLIFLDKLPLLPNGKIDRKSLSVPGVKAGGSAAKPTGDVETKLVEIWSDVLKIEKQLISTTATFFELGGHSVKVFHLINTLQQKFAVKLKLADIFQHSSIQRLAAFLSTLTIHKDPEIVSIGNNALYETSPAQKRIFYQYLMDPHSLIYNIPMAVRIAKTTDIRLLKNSLQKLIDRHEALRSSFLLNDEGVMQKINDTAELNVETLNGRDFETLEDAFNHFIRPFDLSESSLVRFALVEHERAALLFMDVHHIVADGLSIDITIRDFKAIYEGKEPGDLPLRYVDYAAWANRGGTGLTRERNYWAARLSGTLPKLTLPVLNERKDNGVLKARRKKMIIDGALFEQTRQCAVSSGVSDFMLLLSIHYILLAKLSDQQDVIIGTDVVGRSAPVLQNVVGTFVNVLPLRMQVLPGISYAQFLHEVKQCVTDAYENQNFQFDQLVSMLQREGSDSNIFTTHFAFLNTINDHVIDDSFELYHIASKRSALSQYELQIEVRPLPEKFEVTLIYSESLYHDDTIDLLMSYYKNILISVMENIAVQLGDVEMEASLNPV